MQVESYKDMIQLGQESLDLVHSNISSPYTTGLYEAIYYITFLYNTMK